MASFEFDCFMLSRRGVVDDARTLIQQQNKRIYVSDQLGTFNHIDHIAGIYNSTDVSLLSIYRWDIGNWFGVCRPVHHN